MAERWFDRRFELGLDSGALPRVLSRLRSTPDQLEAALADLTAEQLIVKPHGDWSAQENAGHLLDLEPLWYGRLEDLLAGVEELGAADLTNLKTHTAGHNDQPIDTVAAEFRRERERLVDRLEALSPNELEAKALHPRLKQPMSVADLFFFVAEHDDHHLDRIAELADRG